MWAKERFSRLARVAAIPAVTFVAAQACSNQENPEPTIPTPISRTPEGAPGAAYLDPTTGLTVIEPTEIAQTQESSHQATLVSSNSHQYELYQGVTIDQILEKAQNISDPNTQESAVNMLQGIKNILQDNPGDRAITVSLNQVINMADAHCEGENEKEMVKEIASFVNENYPDLYAGTAKLAEQGPCSVLEPGSQVTAPTQEINPNQPEINSEGNFIYTTTRQGSEYTYELQQVPDPRGAIIALREYVVSEELLSYVQNASARNTIDELFQSALESYDKDPNGQKVLDSLLEAGLLMNGVDENNQPICTNRFQRLVNRANASLINALNAPFWQRNQTPFVEGNCFDTERR